MSMRDLKLEERDERRGRQTKMQSNELQLKLNRRLGTVRSTYMGLDSVPSKARGAVRSTASPGIRLVSGKAQVSDPATSEHLT